MATRGKIETIIHINAAIKIPPHGLYNSAQGYPIPPSSQKLPNPISKKNSQKANKFQTYSPKCTKQARKHIGSSFTPNRISLKKQQQKITKAKEKKKLERKNKLKRIKNATTNIIQKGEGILKV